ncbi:MAG TPA: carbohydrate ABC transporter permease [Ruminiclostridium sp.]
MKKTNIFDWLNYGFIAITSLLCALPMVLMVMVSITDERTIQKYGYDLLPKMYSLDAYKRIFTSGDMIVRSYILTVLITVVGTFLAVLITAMAAFALSNKKVRYRNGWSLYFFFTMLFNGGLVPWYLINRALHVNDSIFALLIPNLLFNAFNMFLVRNYMNSLPDELRESAIIDGARDTVIAFKIYFPLSIPVLAAVGLFYGMGYWNDWWNAIMLISDRKLYPLQYMLFALQSNMNMMTDLQKGGNMVGVIVPQESLKMATVVVTVGPIIMLYPFLQRYFIKGLIMGSVKG